MRCEQPSRRGERSRGDELEAPLLHLLGRGNTVSTNGLDTLGVKVRLLLRRVLVLEADVALLREEDAGKIDLWAC